MNGHGRNNDWIPARTGFSLIEVMVSMLILVIGIAGLGIAFQKSIRQSVANKNSFQASIIAESVLAELIATDASGWNIASLESASHFTYQGEKVPEGDADVYFKVTVSRDEQPQFNNITIGVTWLGWKNEQKHGGFGNESDKFAYVLEASVASQYGDAESAGG